VVVLALGLPRERRIALALGFVSAGIMGGCILTSQQEIWRYSSFEGDDWLDALVIVRYGAASGMYAAALVPIALGILARRVAGRLPSSAAPARVASAGLVAAFVALMVAQAPLAGSVREGGAQWSDEVARAQAACSSGDDDATLDVAPTGWSGGGAELPCTAVSP
ncbi:hypothetical protein, partial [Burkholderia cenocepacia]|uniref:hypothetical protein n=1 Tax=Burkholderia cenocepacia TaxID=95486 RepID=UPI0038CC1D75